MKLADGNGQCVGRIGWWKFRKLQDGPDHHLDLPLFGPSVTDDRFLDLQRAVFVDRQPSIRPGQDRHSPDMTLFDQTPDVLPVKNILDRQRHWFRSSDHIIDPITDVLKGHREGGAPNGPDLSVQKARQTLSPLIHHPKSRHMAARIDPQNSHFREPYRVEWRYEPVWRSVCTRSVPPTGSASP